MISETLERQETNLVGNDRLYQEQVLLRVSGLAKAFGGQKVLDGVDLTLSAGEVVLLQGANGSGKTTLLNVLTGNLEPDGGQIELYTHGKVERFRFPMSWWEKVNPWNHFTSEQVAQKGVGRTWQDIRLFNSQSLLDNIAVATPHQLGENPLLAMVRRAEVQQQERGIRKDVSARLAALGLGGREQSSADRVSLGQSKRVAISRALQAGAKVLFLDEPLAGLDGVGIEAVMALLAELARSGLTLVIVEHIFNIPRVLQLATTVWTLAEGRVAGESVAEAQELAVGSTDLGDWLVSLAGEGGKIEDRFLAGGALLSVVRPQRVVLGEVVLEVEDLVIYRGKRLVIGELGEDNQVRGLSFCLRRGELAVLQAPNGWGKTTLLEGLAGLLPIDRGKIRLLGKPIEGLAVWERVRLGLSFLQARDNVFPSLRVRDVLKLARVKQIPETIQGLLTKQMSDLSGGEKQKVIISYFLKESSFKMGILDEPFAALDSYSTPKFQTNLINSLLEKCFLVALPSYHS
jgi:ABC-type branched-subunit amino acid transport system ATPase component